MTGVATDFRCDSSVVIEGAGAHAELCSRHPEPHAREQAGRHRRHQPKTFDLKILKEQGVTAKKKRKRKRRRKREKGRV